MGGEGSDSSEVGDGLGGELAAFTLGFDGLLEHVFKQDSFPIEADNDYGLDCYHDEGEPPRYDQAHGASGGYC